MASASSEFAAGIAFASGIVASEVYAAASAVDVAGAAIPMTTAADLSAVVVAYPVVNSHVAAAVLEFPAVLVTAVVGQTEQYPVQKAMSEQEETDEDFRY